MFTIINPTEVQSSQLIFSFDPKAVLRVFIASGDIEGAETINISTSTLLEKDPSEAIDPVLEAVRSTDLYKRLVAEVGYEPTELQVRVARGDGTVVELVNAPLADKNTAVEGNTDAEATSEAAVDVAPARPTEGLGEGESDSPAPPVGG